MMPRLVEHLKSYDLRRVIRRSRPATLRLLALERLEPRAMLAADFSWETPAVVDLIAQPEADYPIVSPNGGSDSLARSNAPAVKVELIPTESSRSDGVYLGDLVLVRIHVAAGSYPFQELQLQIRYDPTRMIPEGEPVILEGSACSSTATHDFAEGGQCGGFDKRDSEVVVVEVAMRVIAEGMTGVSVSLLRNDFGDGAGISEILSGGRAQFEVRRNGPEVTEGFEPRNPGDGSSPMVDLDGRLPPVLLKRESPSGHALAPRPISLPPAALGDATIDVFFRRASSNGESQSTALESDTLISKRVRVARSAVDWSLLDDASADIFRPLESIGAEVFHADNQGRDSATGSRASVVAVRPEPETKQTDKAEVKLPVVGTATISGLVPINAIPGFSARAELTKLEKAIEQTTENIVVLRAEDIDAMLSNW